METVVLLVRVDESLLDLGYVLEEEDEDCDAWRSSVSFMREVELLESTFPRIVNMEVDILHETAGFSTYKVTIDLLSNRTAVVDEILKAFRSMSAVSDAYLTKKLR
jgi:hypothetical protein